MDLSLLLTILSSLSAFELHEQSLAHSLGKHHGEAVGRSMGSESDRPEVDSGLSTQGLYDCKQVN